MVESCRSNGFTDIVVVHEHRGEPDGLVVCHLPFGTPHPLRFHAFARASHPSPPSPGPTAYFGLVNCVARHDIKEAGLGTVSEAYPHLIFEARPHCQRVGAAAGVSHTHASTCLCRAFPRPWASGSATSCASCSQCPRTTGAATTAGACVLSRV